jgi:hypothetical protein
MNPPKRKTFPSTLRKLCVMQPIIRRVIAEHGVEDLASLRRALREAYPFTGGSNGSYTYQLWARECRRFTEATWRSRRDAECPVSGNKTID